MRQLLRNPAFCRLFSGRLVTNAGDSLYYVAAMWLVYDLSGSTFYTGLAGALTLAPQAFQFLVGPLVDRWSLRAILVRTQVAQGVLVLAIPVAAWTGSLSVGVVLLVMPLLSMLNQFVYPAQSAALPRIVDEEELVEANSAFSFAYQGVDMVFVALGGILVAVVGAVSLFVVDSLTFAIAAVIFAGIRLPPTDGGTESDGTAKGKSVAADYRRKLSEGVGYVRGSVLVPILAASVVVNFTIGAAMAVLPAFADLRGGPEAYGTLLAAVLAGILLGALVASPLKRFGLGRLSVVGFAVSGLCWFAAISAPSIRATAVLFCLAWIPVGVTNVIFAAMAQTIVPDGLLGRVMSLVASASAAAQPVGSLLGGIAGEAVGSTLVISAVGAGFCALTLVYLGHPMLRELPAIEEIEPERYGLGHPAD
ncbi:MFS transporter [Natrononativus amylolyticus]|uniref:MFS transporter n=1 Tax=Natrononativus amylolyticus TaxID=2963434 RepID=UPI0020CBD3B5|nr:MFS transporter [Natrononativus amylolyticus]